jgi:hypothetical protein
MKAALARISRNQPPAIADVSLDVPVVAVTP